ncbi:MAG: helix-turn-helix domain-containing protein [Bacteroidota bacterium]
MLINDLGQAIKSRRNELGITQVHLAELAGVSPNTLYKLERGQINPSLDILNKILDVLGMELKLEIKQKAGK